MKTFKDISWKQHKIGKGNIQGLLKLDNGIELSIVAGTGMYSAGKTGVRGAVDNVEDVSSFEVAVFEYTDDEVTELARCATDIVYFAERYAVVMTDNGIQQVKLREYQKRMLRNFQEERFNIVLGWQSREDIDKLIQIHS